MPEAAAQPTKGEKRRRASVRYPAYSLADSVEVAKRIHEAGGGAASRDRLAAFLNYSTTNSGAYAGRIAAARLFGLISTRASDYVMTPLAEKVLMPVYAEQTREGLVDAFFNVPLFKEIYEEFNGKPIPPEFGFKNLLRSRYGLAVRQADDAYRSLIESADTAGFFTTRNARTHLIIPQINSQFRRVDAADVAVPTENASVLVGGSGPSDTGGRRGAGELQSVKAAYVTALIEMLKDKTAKSGEMDLALMERIEKLLSEPQAAAGPETT